MTIKIGNLFMKNNTVKTHFFKLEELSTTSTLDIYKDNFIKEFNNSSLEEIKNQSCLKNLEELNLNLTHLMLCNSLFFSSRQFMKIF